MTQTYQESVVECISSSRSPYLSIISIEGSLYKDDWTNYDGTVSAICENVARKGKAIIPSLETFQIESDHWCEVVEIDKLDDV